VLAQGGDPLEPPMASRPRDSVTGPWALLAQGGDPLEPPMAASRKPHPGLRFDWQTVRS